MTLATSQTGKALQHNVSWEEFENILAQMGDNRAARVAYDRGTLEVIMLLTEHLAHQSTSKRLLLESKSLGKTYAG